MTLRLTDTSPMPFGKHAGKQMQKVPASYLLWLDSEMERAANCDGPRRAVREYINENRKALESEGDNEEDDD